MGRYVMIGLSAAKPERDEAYNDWFDNTHLPAILALPGMKSVRRFDATPYMIGAPGPRYLSIFEVETDDIQGLIAEMGRRSAAGDIAKTDEIDETSAGLWFYEERG